MFRLTLTTRWTNPPLVYVYFCERVKQLLLKSSPDLAQTLLAIKNWLWNKLFLKRDMGSRLPPSLHKQMFEHSGITTLWLIFVSPPYVDTWVSTVVHFFLCVTCADVMTTGHFPVQTYVSVMQAAEWSSWQFCHCEPPLDRVQWWTFDEQFLLRFRYRTG